MEIIPGILEHSVDQVMAKVALLPATVSRIHLDVIDGVFADNLTPLPSDYREIEFGKRLIDFHLMVEEPVDYVSDCANLKARAGGIRVIGQVERMGKQAEFVTLAQGLKCGVGLGLDLYTPVSAIERQVLPALDCVLLMSVKTGFSGQHFNHLISEKILRLREAGFAGQIIMDGGGDPKHALLARAAGADAFAVTSYLWQHEDVAQALKEYE